MTRDAMTHDAASERAAIVAWLRGETDTDYTDPEYDIGVNLAAAIERGAHLDHHQPTTGRGECT